jgi:hypothetical protein
LRSRAASPGPSPQTRALSRHSWLLPSVSSIASRAVPTLFARSGSHC